MKWIVTTTCSFDQNVTAVEFSAEQEEKAKNTCSGHMKDSLKSNSLKSKGKKAIFHLTKTPATSKIGMQESYG